jgi:prepilin-type N-terminal cleavage/methylation domain-containing protein/prepilin-type processing-associated H-X9-DG protein
MARRSGFTLIELLVVIAIIGILAAMLFPVFARARESARKIQCLSNVKNIAMAVQMYLADYDRFPPNNKDYQLLAWLDEQSGDNGCSENYGYHRFNGADPYLEWPVILDEYIKNRDVWFCPSARTVGSAGWIVPQYTAVYWWYYRDNGFGCCGPCGEAWPPGWGGSVTDSIKQQTMAFDDPGSFRWTIATTAVESYNRSTSELGDASHWVVCGDSQVSLATMQQMWNTAYGGDPVCCLGLSEEEAARYYADVAYRKTFAPHMGGLNLGFADGHAKWFDAETILLGGHDHTRNGIHPQVYYGLCVCINLTNKWRSDLPEWNDSTAGVY